ARRTGTEPAVPPLLPVPRQGALPLSFAQQRLWFIDQLEPGRSTYNMPFPLRIRGGLEVGALERALTEIVRRHETLRTCFVVVDGEPLQVVREAAPVVLPLVELGGLPEGARDAELARLSRDEARRPFDLATGPLLRVVVVRLGEREAGVLFTLHHIVCDGWSMGILVREVSTLYAAFSRGEEVRLPELPIQYADYAVWQRGWLSGGTLEAEIGWWRERLVGAPTLLELPTDRPRPAVASGAAATRAVRVGADTAARLRALSRREGATPFMTLLSLWQLLLGRYSGREDLLVGTPIAGRNRMETEGLIGFFVNTLVLRADLSGDPTVRELLHRVRERTLGAYQHQELPFEKLVEELGVERSLAHTPLFQVMFSLQNNEGGELELGGAGLEGLGVESASAKFDLTLTLTEEEEIRGGLTYRTGLWEDATIGRMLEHYARLLEEASAHPERRLSEFSLLGAAERAQVLEGWNATAAELPRERRVHELFSEQAARTPDVAAVVFGTRHLTYAELDRRSSQLAHALRRRGVGPETRVALLLERSPELVVAVLGILKAGGAYLPLDPTHPRERLARILEDATAPLLLTRSHLRERLPATAAGVLCLDRDAEEIGREPAGPPPVEVAPQNLAYVIYTSGSTGTPKGVLVEHRALFNYLLWFDRTVLGEHGFALPLVSRLSFDAHVRQLFPPLLRGEPVWVLPEETVADPAALLEALASQERVSFGGVPSLWSALLERVRTGEGPKPRGLVAVLLGGETLSPELVERTRAFFPGVALWNHYGPTEATVNTTVARVEEEGRVTLGRPIANVRVYVLDGAGRPAPLGVPGELYA
ncbi:MAG TPA: condensation domain-containing protein, partial [Longimicrobiaceae bacterium]|nr:condensation domain-containing protein [Longimicrobiaceae bacterium]